MNNVLITLAAVFAKKTNRDQVEVKMLKTRRKVQRLRSLTNEFPITMSMLFLEGRVNDSREHFPNIKSSPMKVFEVKSKDLLRDINLFSAKPRQKVSISVKQKKIPIEVHHLPEAINHSHINQAMIKTRKTIQHACINYSVILVRKYEI